MTRKIINAYPRFKEFNDLAMAATMWLQLP